MVLGAWGGFRKRIVTTLTSMIALGVAVIAIGLTPPSSFLWMLVATSCVGLFVPLVNGPVFAILQITIAPDYQGRVFSLITSLAGGMAPLGLLAAAPVAEMVGVGAWCRGFLHSRVAGHRGRNHACSRRRDCGAALMRVANTECRVPCASGFANLRRMPRRPAARGRECPGRRFRIAVRRAAPVPRKSL
jgi:hypothetical protein